MKLAAGIVGLALGEYVSSAHHRVVYTKGGGGGVGGGLSMTRGLFATMLERAETQEAFDLNPSRLCPTRPVYPQHNLSILIKNSNSEITLCL
jgi:hypothetical protein